MELHALSLPPLGANCYLLQNGPRGLIIDPGGDAQAVVHTCQDLGMTPEAVILTHGHFDHVGAVPELCRVYPLLPVYLHDLDAAASDPQLFPLAVQLERAGYWDDLRSLDEECLELAGFHIHVLHTPGHSEGSCCFQVGEQLFTGDTLFRGSIGRTDFPGGSSQAMRASLARLAALPGDYRLCPGHDAPTTLDQEREHNPYLQGISL